jgi:hypothetical protein
MQKARGHSAKLLPPLVGRRFQVLFHSPSGVLFTFPSRYLSAIGHLGVLSLGGWSPQFQTAFHGCGPTQERVQEVAGFAYGTIALFGARFHALRLAIDLVTPARPVTTWKHVLQPRVRNAWPLARTSVWADPLSLATTHGVSVDLLSSGY